MCEREEKVDFCKTSVAVHILEFCLWSEPFWVGLTLFQSLCLWSRLVITGICLSEPHSLLILSQRSGFLDKGVPAFCPLLAVEMIPWQSEWMLWLPSWLFEGALGPCGQASTSLQGSVSSYPCTRQRSGLVMGTRWGLMCLNKDTFWTIRNNWVAVYTLNSNLTAVLARWPRRNRAESPLCCPDQTIPHHPCFCQGGHVYIRWGCV